MSHADEFEHFVHAQDAIYDQVVGELRAGRKQSHWMWFIFPQIRGLGRSAISERFALDSLDQARRYLEHKILGRRLRECTQLVLNVQGRTAEDIFGYPDYLKFRSSMTLFGLAAEPHSVFARAIDKYYAGEPDDMTLGLLGQDIGHWRQAVDGEL